MSIRYHNPPGSGPAQGLYSNVGSVLSQHIHFVAGQLAVAPDGEVAGVGDFDVQFDQIFENLKNVLIGMGGDLTSVIKYTTFVTSRDYIQPFMKKRAAFFPTVYRDEIFPPNTLLIVNGLVKPEFVIEVEAVVLI